MCSLVETESASPTTTIHYVMVAVDSRRVRDMTKSIELFACDVDGTLTDSCTYYSRNGEVMKKFNMKDGMGFMLLKQNGVIPIILTKEKSDVVLSRTQKLGIKEVHIGVQDKLKKLLLIAARLEVEKGQIAYIGDDINDLEAMKAVGLSFAPSDAIREVKKVADVVTKRGGGKGSVREAIDYVLEMNKR